MRLISIVLRSRIAFISLHSEISIVQPSYFGYSDGSVLASGEGLSFDWHGANPQQLSFGAYLLTISSGNCSEDTVVLVNQPSPLGYAWFAEAPACAGYSDGALRLYPFGGVEPY